MSGGSSNAAGVSIAEDKTKDSLNPTNTTSEAKLKEELEQEEAESGDEDIEDAQDPTEASAESSSKGRKKRKPKKKKKDKAAAAGEEDNAKVMAAGQDQPVPAKDIQQLLQQLALSTPDAQKPKGKSPEDYKFWNTQPVPKFTEPNLLQTTTSGGMDGQTLPEGAILPDHICAASARDEPERLVEGFDWDLVDLEGPAEMNELYDLLYNHYVEDTEGSFRFNYSTEFLAWALKPPGWRREWHIGVRTKTDDASRKGKLVAFISGVPVVLKIREQEVKAVEINFLTIHRKLRSKRLAPVLIKEVTRQCYRNGIYQALYTAGTVLPTPVTTCRYFHRSLDWAHLYRTGFSHLPHRSTESMQIRKYFLPSRTETRNLRPMQTGDVEQVGRLLERYLARFHLKQKFSAEEIKHLFCSEASKGVVWAYVVEETGRVTDLVSFYLLESTVLKANSNTKTTIRAAYLYYYASETAFAANSSATYPPPALKPRLESLIHDALIIAKRESFHVFNALTLLDNPLFLKDQKFEPGDGRLNYYLFNWRTPGLGGGVNERDEVDVSRGGGVGVVML